MGNHKILVTRQKLSSTKSNISWSFPASLNFSSFNKMVATCHYEDGDNWQEKRGEKKRIQVSNVIESSATRSFDGVVRWRVSKRIRLCNFRQCTIQILIVTRMKRIFSQQRKKKFDISELCCPELTLSWWTI